MYVCVTYTYVPTSSQSFSRTRFTAGHQPPPFEAPIWFVLEDHAVFKPTIRVTAAGPDRPAAQRIAAAGGCNQPATVSSRRRGPAAAASVNHSHWLQCITQWKEDIATAADSARCGAAARRRASRDHQRSAKWRAQARQPAERLRRRHANSSGWRVDSADAASTQWATGRDGECIAQRRTSHQAVGNAE